MNAILKNQDLDFKYPQTMITDDTDDWEEYYLIKEYTNITT